MISSKKCDIMSKDSLSKNIMSLIDTQINDFISCVSRKYNIDSVELTGLWNSDEPMATSTKIDIIVSSTSHVPSVEVKTDNVCQHLWIKGVRKGTICGCVVKNPTKRYCVKHVNQNKSPTVSSPSNGVVKPTSKVIRRNKTIDKLWHEESCMVFESIDDRRIIGKYSDGKVMILNEADVQTCKELGFVIKPSIDDRVVTDPDVIKNTVDEVDKIDEVEKLLSSMMVGEDDELLEEE